ncbi:hypothetical protein L665_01074 [Ralstonia solanacearum SD54]|nr:hypothetical protein L665_01074 [Ralstonia solanacearum SD54]
MIRKLARQQLQPPVSHHCHFTGYVVARHHWGIFDTWAVCFAPLD